MVTRLKFNEALTGEEPTHNKKRKQEHLEKMLALADICRSYKDYEDKSKYMDILVRHWGRDGKGTSAKE